MVGLPAQIRAAASVLLDRVMFLRQAGLSFKGARDLYEVLGYDRVLTNKVMRDRYARGGVAGRIVDCFPDATWRGEVDIVEDEDPKVSTVFEQAWADLDKRLQIQAKLQRADKLAGLSSYAVILIGAPGDLETELPKGRPDQVLYLTAFSGGGGPGGDTTSRAAAQDADCSIFEFDVDPTSPRFGLPLTYQLRRTNMASPLLQRRVHWTRIIHVAEGCLHDEVYGQPRLERVWNLLDDLDKITGGGAEAFWLRANQGLHLDIDKDMTLPDAKAAIDALKDQSEDYKHQVTRWLRTRGVNVNTLGSDVANFANPADAVLTQISGALGIPKRILTGSEMGELASSQDRDNWKDRINGRQTGYVGPYIIRPLVGRLIEYGYLPTPQKGPDAYNVVWPHIQTLTEQEKADGAKTWASTNQIMGMTVFTEQEIRDKWYGMEPAEEFDSEMYKAKLAESMAMTNKTQGVTVFTPAEIRKTAYGWKPLDPSLEVPIGAPERVSVTSPPPLDEKGAPITAPAKQLPAPTVASEHDAELLRVLEAAIEAGATEVIERIVGITNDDEPTILASRFNRFLQPISAITVVSKARALGGEGSGNFGHEGRPGEIGGSGEGGGSGKGDKSLPYYAHEKPVAVHWDKESKQWMAQTSQGEWKRWNQNTGQWYGIKATTAAKTKVSDNTSKPAESLPELGLKGVVKDGSADASSWPITDDAPRTMKDNNPRALYDDSANWEKVLSDSETESLQDYSANSEEINQALWNKTGEMASVVANITSAIDKAPAPPPPVLIWRGVSASAAASQKFLSSISNGDVLQLSGFQSTSINPRSVGKWAGKGGVVFEIKPSKGAYLESVSWHKGEFEFLLPCNDKYAVRGVKDIKVGGKTRTVVQLEQLR